MQRRFGTLENASSRGRVGPLATAGRWFVAASPRADSREVAHVQCAEHLLALSKHPVTTWDNYGLGTRSKVNSSTIAQYPQ